MPDTYPTPRFNNLPLKSALLSLPKLGGGRGNYAALRALRSIHQFEWMNGPKPTLKMRREDVLHKNKHFRDAWRHVIGQDAITVFADRSCLIFKSIGPDQYEVLPFVFRLPATVPFLSGHPLEGESNMIFDIRGSDRLRFGIAPHQRVKQFVDIEDIPSAPDDIGQVLAATLQTLSIEVPAWIEATQGISTEDDTQGPISLSMIKENSDAIEKLRTWLSKITTYGCECINAPGNALSISLFDPAFSQTSRVAHFEIEIKSADHVHKDIVASILDNLHDLLLDNKAPVHPDDLFSQISFRDTKRHLHTHLPNLDFHLEAFAIVDLSYHERLKLETQFGFRQIAERHNIILDA